MEKETLSTVPGFESVSFDGQSTALMDSDKHLKKSIILNITSGKSDDFWARIF